MYFNPARQQPEAVFAANQHAPRHLS